TFLGFTPAFINKESLFGIFATLMVITSFIVLVYLLNKFLKMRVIAFLKQIANWLRLSKIKEDNSIENLKSAQIVDIQKITVDLAEEDKKVQRVLEAIETISLIEVPMNVAFVVGMYNEQRRLLPKTDENPFGEDALRRKVEQLQELHQINQRFNWQLLLVDDGTPSMASAECARRLWEKIQGEYAEIKDILGFSQIQVVADITPDIKKKLGSQKGYAVRYGMQMALDQMSDRYIGYTDADLSTDLRQTGLLVYPFIGRAEIGAAIGSRRAPGAFVENVPLEGQITSILFNLYVRSVLGPIRKVRDTQRGFKLFRPEVLSAILPEAKDGTFSFDTELLLLTRLAGYEIAEVGIHWRDSTEASTFSSVSSNTFKILKNITGQREHIENARQRKRSEQASKVQGQKRVEGKRKRRSNNKGFVINEMLLSFTLLMVSAAMIYQIGPIAGLGILVAVLSIIFIAYLIKRSGSRGGVGSVFKNIITFNGVVRSKTKAFAKVAREIESERRLVNSIHERWREAVVVFGSARIPDNDPLYLRAMEIGKELFKAGMAVRSGAGPSMMEAPLKGYIEERIRQGIAKSLYNMTQGIRIKLPFEQKTSPYVEDNYEFNHFVIRKMGLYNNCRGIIAMPGGFGTMDELFEVWFRQLPIVLVGIEYWTPIIDEIRRVTRDIGAEGQIANWPLMTDSPQEAVRMIKESEPRILKETKDEVDVANKDLESNMQRLSKWERSVTFIGQKEIKNSVVEEVVRTLAKMLDAKDIPGRSVTRNKNIGIALIMASKGRHKIRQQTILMPEIRFLYQKKNRIVTRSATNHHVLIEQNSRAFVFLPGRIKTLSRLFDLVAVMQTGKVEKRPIVLIGKFFWEPVIGAIAKAALDCPSGALIKKEDIKLFIIVDSAEEAFKHLGLENIQSRSDRTKLGESLKKNRDVFRKRMTATIMFLSIANVSVFFREEYAAFIGSATWLGALLLRLFLGAATRGVGVYIKQAVKGEHTDYREIFRWMIVGAFMVGLLVFAVLYPVIRQLGLTPVGAALFDLLIYAPLVSLPLSFILYEYFISRKAIKKKITLKNIFMTGKSSVKTFYIIQLVYWFTVLTIGWTWFAEYMDIYIVNMSIIWSALLAFMFDRTKEAQDNNHENDQHVLRQEKTPDKYTITSLLLYGFVEKIIKTNPDAGKAMKIYADMLVMLEEYLAMSGKVRAGPAIVAYYDPILDAIVYNLSPEE
ncbi:MAG: LOG family protein, partial [Candidatus Omnitrophica bacterium]|nr:LOG family protein [Candidatus Omnitrophota bacterium]